MRVASHSLALASATQFHYPAAIHVGASEKAWSFHFSGRWHNSRKENSLSLSLLSPPPPCLRSSPRSFCTAVMKIIPRIWYSRGAAALFASSFSGAFLHVQEGSPDDFRGRALIFEQNKGKIERVREREAQTFRRHCSAKQLYCCQRIALLLYYPHICGARKERVMNILYIFKVCARGCARAFDSNLFLFPALYFDALHRLVALGFFFLRAVLLSFRVLIFCWDYCDNISENVSLERLAEAGPILVSESILWKHELQMRLQP